MDKRARFRKNPGRSKDQVILPKDKNNDLTKDVKPKKTVRIQEEPVKKTTMFNIEEENEEAPKIIVTQADDDKEDKDDDSSDGPPIKRRVTKNETQHNKKEILANLKK